MHKNLLFWTWEFAVKSRQCHVVKVSVQKIRHFGHANLQPNPGTAMWFRSVWLYGTCAKSAILDMRIYITYNHAPSSIGNKLNFFFKNLYDPVWLLNFLWGSFSATLNGTLSWKRVPNRHTGGCISPQIWKVGLFKFFWLSLKKLGFLKNAALLDR
jgi:hypothetical protein